MMAEEVREEVETLVGDGEVLLRVLGEVRRVTPGDTTAGGA